MTNKLAVFSWILALIGLVELLLLPVWESLLFLHATLAGMTLLVVLTRPRTIKRDLVGLATSILDSGRSALIVLAIALSWMTLAMFVISFDEYNELENLYGVNAPIFGLAGLLVYPFIPILLSPRQEYHDLLYQRFRQEVLDPRVLEEFLMARNDEKKMEQFTSAYFPEVSSLYKENEKSRVTLEFFSLFRNLEARLKEDPGFAPILESYQRSSSAK
ncbi:MAG: hypothetical protein ACFFB3_00845 [Candidatus Hodarchaeota archaeon]